MARDAFNPGVSVHVVVPQLVELVVDRYVTLQAHSSRKRIVLLGLGLGVGLGFGSGG